jgi:hypothetical protein
MSTVIRTKSFTDAGEEFETRAMATGDGVHVQVFRGEKPVGLAYSVSGAVRHDFAAYVELDAVDHLIDLATRDFENRGSYTRPERLPGITVRADVSDADEFLRRLEQVAEGSTAIGCSYYAKSMKTGVSHVNAVRLPYDDDTSVTVQVLDWGAAPELAVEGRSNPFSVRRPSAEGYVRAVREVLDPLLDLYAQRFGHRLEVTVK